MRSLMGVALGVLVLGAAGESVAKPATPNAYATGEMAWFERTTDAQGKPARKLIGRSCIATGKKPGPGNADEEKQIFWWFGAGTTLVSEKGSFAPTTEIPAIGGRTPGLSRFSVQSMSDKHNVFGDSLTAKCTFDQFDAYVAGLKAIAEKNDAAKRGFADTLVDGATCARELEGMQTDSGTSFVFRNGTLIGLVTTKPGLIAPAATKGEVARDERTNCYTEAWLTRKDKVETPPEDFGAAKELDGMDSLVPVGLTGFNAEATPISDAQGDMHRGKPGKKELRFQEKTVVFKYQRVPY